MHLRIVTPIVSAEFGMHFLESVRAQLRPTTRLDTVTLEYGPPTIETELDEALAIPGTLVRVAEAAEAGCDALILNCVGDPGLAAARELVRIPVLGPGLVGMHLAVTLGTRFSAIVASERGFPAMKALVERYGMHAWFASVRALSIPILELERDPDRLVEALFDTAQVAIHADGADVILLGSTGMTSIAPRLSARLREAGLSVPVVDPLLAAVLLAESLVLAGVTHSRPVGSATDVAMASGQLRKMLGPST